MANGHVEIHDLFSSGHRSPSSSSEAEADGSRTDDSVEFRIMMAFADRRRPQQEEEKPKRDDGGLKDSRDDGGLKDSRDDGGLKDSRDANGTTSPSHTPEKTAEKKKRKKKKWKRLPGFLRCVKPQTEDPEPQQTLRPNANFRSLSPPADEPPVVISSHPDDSKDGLSEAVSRLTEIADEIPFSPPEWETDSPSGDKDDEVEKVIGLILREAGDRLNEKELKDANISAELFWNYGFFRDLINKLLMRMGLRSNEPDALGPQASPKTQIAVTCEVTSRLSELNSLNRNLLMRHGARYLQDYYSTWAQQQGGYEAAFEGDEDEVE